MLNSLEFSKNRLQAILDEIKNLNESEFPYDIPQKALKNLELYFRVTLSEISDQYPQDETINDSLNKSLDAVFTYLPILGFILRSTNVRNAFEVFKPMLRLAWKLLGTEVKLILSSEWDYSPHVYLNIPLLPGYVLVGIPASESSNPLLFPLAGHELGHPLWWKHSLEKEIGTKLTKKIVAMIHERWEDFKRLFPDPNITESNFDQDKFTPKTWKPSAEWAQRQAEESFCDFVGVKIFGKSYLYAFAYLISPTLPGRRPFIYPDMLTRVDNLINAYKLYFGDDRFLKGFKKLFTGEDPRQKSLSESEQFLLNLADKALKSISRKLIKKAGEIIDDSKIIKFSKKEIDRIYSKFKQIVPAPAPIKEGAGLADILNAAWKAFADDKLFKNREKIQKKEKRDKVLKDLVLKTIEVFEIDQIKREKKKRNDQSRRNI